MFVSLLSCSTGLYWWCCVTVNLTSNNKMIISTLWIYNCNTECINMSVCCQEGETGQLPVGLPPYTVCHIKPTQQWLNPVIYHIRFMKYCRRLQRWCTSEDVSLLSGYVHITDLNTQLGCLLVTWVQLQCVQILTWAPCEQIRFLRSCCLFYSIFLPPSAETTWSLTPSVWAESVQLWCERSFCLCCISSWSGII